MRQKLFVAILVLITAAYCWGLGWIAWGFSRAGGAIGWGLALGVVILLALTVWVTWREVLFGLASGRLAHEYERQAQPAPALPGDQGRADQEAAPDARTEFESARSAIQEGGQEDWQGWFRLALAYDALHDRRSARSATRQAIEVRRRSGASR